MKFIILLHHLLPGSQAHIFRVSSAQRAILRHTVKGIITVCFLGLSITPIHSQQNLMKLDTKKIHFGILMGINRSGFLVVHADEITSSTEILNVDSPRAAGFNLGIISNLKLSKRFDLRSTIPTLSFAEKNLRYTEIVGNEQVITNNTIESIFLDFPLDIKYKSDRFNNNFRFYILGGLKGGLDLASNSKKRRANDIVKLGSWDLGMEFGFGFEIYFPYFMFTPEIKFYQGMNNIHVPTEGLRYSDVLDKLRSRTITLSFQFEG